MDNVATQRLGEGVFKEPIYRHVYADSKARFTTPFGSRRPICYGDRLFARLVRHGRTLLEFVVTEVCDFTEFMGELRKKAKGLKGLVRLQVRNYSRGWSMEQPLMLYASPSSSYAACNQQSSGCYDSCFTIDSSFSSPSPAPSRMLFPWETH